MKLQNRVALVTGAGRGLGRSIALKLAREGARIVVSDILLEHAEDAAKEIKALGGDVLAVQTNVANKQDVERLFEKTLSEFERIDILVNNAGINRDVQLYKMTDEEWDQVIAVNLTGTFYTTREASKVMREQNYGRIVNISSMSWSGNFGQANYAASKAGVIGLTKTASRELAKKGITCNAICPGFIETEMTRGVPEKVWDIMVGKIAAGRAGEPDDVAAVVAFLASDEAAYVTGEVINVSGGMVL